MTYLVQSELDTVNKLLDKFNQLYGDSEFGDLEISAQLIDVNGETIGFIEMINDDYVFNTRTGTED